MALGTFKLFNSFAATAMSYNWVRQEFFDENFINIFNGILIMNNVKPNVADTTWKYKVIPALTQYPFVHFGHLTLEKDPDTGITTMYTADTLTWPPPGAGTSDFSAAQKVAYCVIVRGFGGSIANMPRVGFIDLTSNNGVTPRDISATGMTLSFNSSTLFTVGVNR